ncbi:MAG: RHS repeat-associated core domain-containing protein [Candidatus Coatesbacteria bacterium]|nr:RHS repeat-associated core domain-containing protein [Candidatus Coatesbacteria bacterium]
MTDSSGTRKFFYDGDDVIQEYNSDWSSVMMQCAHGTRMHYFQSYADPVGEHVPSSPHRAQRLFAAPSPHRMGAEALRLMKDHASREASETHYLMKDRIGSIINILDENETIKTTYSYDAFGDPTATYHSGQVDCMYRFTGRVFDGAMGNCFYRARYYNQSLGRFFSRDPIMSLQSLYAYCNNSPTNYTDPSGMVTGEVDGISLGMICPGFGPLPGDLPPGLPCVGWIRDTWNRIWGRGRDESKDKKQGNYEAKHTSTNSDGTDNYDIYYNGKQIGEYRSGGPDTGESTGPNEYTVYGYGTWKWFDLGGLTDEDLSGVEVWGRDGMNEQNYWRERSLTYAWSSLGVGIFGLTLVKTHWTVALTVGCLTGGLAGLSLTTYYHPGRWFVDPNDPGWDPFW